MSTGFPLRRAFERLLGPKAMAYLLHLRPAEWPVMTAHFLLGTLLASGWGTFTRHPGTTLLGWFVFVILMNGGTLAINSAFDRDEGDVGYLKAPPRPPRHLLAFSAALLGLSLLLGFLLPPVFAWSNAACVLMSVLYSVPPVRLKARAGWDLLINCLGFGLLTPLAGWGLGGAPASPAFRSVILGFAFLFGALYPLTQIYQVEEDRARGDRTLVLMLGEGPSLGLATGLALVAHLWFAWALAQQGRLLPFLLPSLAAWMAVLLPWWARWRRWTPARHERGMYHALAAWAVTDFSLLAMLWPR